MSNRAVADELRFLIQWFRTWSELQKDDFVQVLGQKLSPSTITVNGIVNGVQNLDTSGRPVSLFACQIKLFGEWWDTWSEEDRGKLTCQLKDSDAKFWAEVEGELDGSRKKELDDYFKVDSSLVSSVSVSAAEPESVTVAVRQDPAGSVSIGKDVDEENDTLAVRDSDHEDMEDATGDHVPNSVTNIKITGDEIGATDADNEPGQVTVTPAQGGGDC